MSVSSFFKKRVHNSGASTANVQMTEAEAALAQSDFNIDKITEIQNKFTGGVTLLVPGRIFIREGQLWKVCRKGPKRRQFFLFNDILVYGSVVAGRYSNQHVLPLAQMTTSSECHYQPRVQAEFDVDSEQLDQQMDVNNAFQISHFNKSFHVFAHSAADKANWLANLHKHIGRVSATSEQQKQQFMARAVWVPDSSCRSCMVCTTRFTAFIRKHHCRRCGRVVCGSCSPHRLDISEGFSGGKVERVCNDCFREMSKTTVEVQWHTATAERDGTESPPPPAVAAQVVSSVLRSAVTKETTPPSNQGGGANQDQSGNESTDTSDSDDSENEEMVTYKPESKSPDPQDKSHDEGSLSVPASSNGGGQPTPPPRKKKIQKQQQKEREKVMLQELKKLSSQPDDSTAKEEVPEERLSQEESGSQQSSSSLPSQEASPQPLPRTIAGMKPRKTRRKQKYVTPEELATQQASTQQPSSSQTEEKEKEQTSGPAEMSDDKDEMSGAAGLASVEDTDSVEVKGRSQSSPDTPPQPKPRPPASSSDSPEQSLGRKARGRKKRFVQVETNTN